MWLHLEESNSTGNEMVLTEQEGRAIIHNKQRGDLSQQWKWNDKNKIVNIGNGQELTDGNGDATLSKDGASWWYDSENMKL